MKKLLLYISIILITSSGFAQKIEVDYDKNFDFSTYKSFQYLGWQEDGDVAIGELDKKRLRESFKNEFEARQLNMVEDNAQFAISLFVVANQKTSVSAYTDHYGGSNYRYGRGGRGWGGGYSTTTYTENSYVYGSLVVDVFDVKSKELVWQGVASGVINSKAKKREKSIPKTVSKLMKKFPIPKMKN